MAKAATRPATRIAKPQEQRFKPAFSVVELEGKFERRLISYENGKRVERMVERPAGYLVTMLNGHSIRVENATKLRALGFDQTIPVLDEEGEEQFALENNILAEAS